MTTAKPAYYDEDDNLREIKKIIKNESYSKLFIFLKEHFKTDASVTVYEVQLRLGVPIYSKAWQLLESFVFLNLLKKQKVGAKKSVYIKNKESWWEIY
jgi:hypothetical protein